MSGCVPVAGDGIISSFSRLGGIPLYTCAASTVPTHLSTDTYCLHVSSIVNRAVNIGVRVPFWIRVLSGSIFGSGIAGSYGNSSFLGGKK